MRTATHILLLALLLICGCSEPPVKAAAGKDSTPGSTDNPQTTEPESDTGGQQHGATQQAVSDEGTTARSEPVKDNASGEAAVSGQRNAADSGEDVANLWTRQTGSDWSSFLGPDRNSKSPESGILKEWPTSGPPVVWTKDLGTSYGIGSISRGRFVQCDRYGDQVRLYCLNAETGEELWRYEYTSHYEDMYGYNNGPRCSPVIDQNRVYMLGVDGLLLCVQLSDGKLLWKIDTSEKYDVVQNFFGVGSTPLIDGDLLITIVGGSPPESPAVITGRTEPSGTAVVAFDKYSGEEKYRVGDDLASYASPVVASIGGRRYGLAFCRNGLLAFAPQSGERLFHYPWRATIVESVNAATPIVVDDQIFITETYGPGSTMLKPRGEKYDIVWKDEERSRDKAMQAHWNTPLHIDGYLYGSSGRHTGNAELRCVRASDGKVMWSEPGLTRSSLLYVDGHFVCLSENGLLRLLKVNPRAYEVVAQTILRDPAGPGDFRAPNERILLSYPAWAAPILSHGLLYVRGRDKLVCLELIPEK